MNENQNDRAAVKALLEKKVQELRELSTLSGFKLDAKLVDPVEEAVSDHPLLVVGRRAIWSALSSACVLADEIGYNVSITRNINPLDPRNPEVVIDIWGKRNEDGNYD